MRDKRPVDELSIEELERILAVKRREQRQQRMQKLHRDGRVVESAANPVEALAPQPTMAPAMAQPPTPVIKQPPVREPGMGPRFEDDPEDSVYSFDHGASERSWRRFLNGLLLIIEIAAVGGLIYLGVNLFQAITTLETETASAVAMADQQRRAGIPTIAPTPQISIDNIVLPGGHVITETGAVQFNYNEVPAHLYLAVQEQILQPPPRRPEPTDETPLRLVIPKLNLDQTIVQGVDWEALRQGIGQLPNGVTPADSSGNLVLAAHNDIYGEFFRHLDQLEAGDKFQILTRTQVYNYTITHWEVVEPTDVYVMETQRGKTATLISCYPYQVNDKRIAVFATLDA
jgi:sortase A